MKMKGNPGFLWDVYGCHYREKSKKIWLVPSFFVPLQAKANYNDSHSA